MLHVAAISSPTVLCSCENHLEYQPLSFSGPRFAGDLPLILAGDFNFRPGSAPYELLTTGKLNEDGQRPW